MIDSIGSSSSYYSPGTSNSTSRLAQTEEKLFAAIDTDGDGSITQSEFSNFLNQSASASGAGAPTQTAQTTLFGQLSGGGNAINLQQFQANAGDLFSQLQSEIAAGKSGSTSTAASTLLSQLSQSAASLAAGSAAGVTGSSSSSATSNTHNTGNHSHHGHGGHSRGSSLISQFVQQYQAAGATPTTAAPTVSTSA
jgi:hypothetical protein